MDNNTLSIYIHELRNHCKNLQASFDIFNRSLLSNHGQGVLYGAQMILMPASQISALLWPTRARARGRGETLRKALGLPEKHALNDRRLSELWERADEKFEEWINTTRQGQLVFDYVGDPHALHPDIEDKNVYRAYNPETHLLYYRGIAYNLPAVAKALEDVGARVNTLFRQMFPENARIEDEAREYMKAEAAKQQAANNQALTGAGTVGDTTVDLSASLQTPDADTESTATDTKKPAKKAAEPKTGAKKPAAKKAATAKKAPAKKEAAKKESAAKPTAKKTPTKKPTAKAAKRADKK